jgi:hypothetical protein
LPITGKHLICARRKILLYIVSHSSNRSTMSLTKRRRGCGRAAATRIPSRFFLEFPAICRPFCGQPADIASGWSFGLLVAGNGHPKIGYSDMPRYSTSLSRCSERGYPGAGRPWVRRQGARFQWIDRLKDYY